MGASFVLVRIQIILHVEHVGGQKGCISLGHCRGEEDRMWQVERREWGMGMCDNIVVVVVVVFQVFFVTSRP